jgi:transposase
LWRSGSNGADRTVAHVATAKYADHLPLFGQAQVYARQGKQLDRPTLVGWSGRAGFLLRPVHKNLLKTLRASSKLFADDTTALVLLLWLAPALQGCA